MQQEMSVLGIDIAKRVFHAVGMDNTGKIVLRKRLPRHDLMPFQGSGQNDVHPEHGMRTRFARYPVLSQMDRTPS